MDSHRVNTVLCFSNNLRLHDNMALYESSQQTSQLLCIYCIDPEWFQKDRFGLYSIGTHRWQFLLESLAALDKSLRSLGQALVVVYGKQHDVIQSLLERYSIGQVVRSKSVGYNENKQWEKLCSQYQHVRFKSVVTHSLFKPECLPFDVAELPSTFSEFRKDIESTGSLYFTDSIDIIPLPTSLPPRFYVDLPFQVLSHVKTPFEAPILPKAMPFIGGENNALQHLAAYFQTDAPSRYKDTRNALETDDDAWSLSAKISPWLANGCLSVKEVLYSLRQYEQNYGSNDSTYWMYFELLWREYFQWYALAHGHSLFSFRDMEHPPVLINDDPEQFNLWRQAKTPWPLVNACMGQLNQTGFLSNRGRQIVASCLVNELGIDWRCGAAYFEQQLVDYDIAANWGNWQCIAGLGADPGGRRHFNIIKQQYIYDPKREYVSRWVPRDTPLYFNFIDSSENIEHVIDACD